MIENNVLPLNDLWPHVELPTCWCAPFIETVIDAERMQPVRLIIHHALDGRTDPEPIEGCYARKDQ